VEESASKVETLSRICVGSMANRLGCRDTAGTDVTIDGRATKAWPPAAKSARSKGMLKRVIVNNGFI
jgi:hypothetical protein